MLVACRRLKIHAISLSQRWRHGLNSLHHLDALCKTITQRRDAELAETTQRRTQVRTLRSPRQLTFIIISTFLLITSCTSCRRESDPQGLRPRQLRDVPAGKLAFKFTADVDPPTGLPNEENKSISAIQDD